MPCASANRPSRVTCTGSINLFGSVDVESGSRVTCAGSIRCERRITRHRASQNDIVGYWKIHLKNDCYPHT